MKKCVSKRITCEIHNKSNMKTFISYDEITKQRQRHKLCGDGPGGVDVVPGDHTDCDAGSLALLY